MEQHEDNQTQTNIGTAVEEVGQVIKQEDKKEWMLPASIVFAAVVIGAAFIYASGPGAAPVDQNDKGVVTAPPLTDKDVVLGNANAPMTIIEYGDFQCPGCVSFFMTGEGLIKKQLVETGKAKFVFRPFPIVDQIVGKGTESVDSSLALLCARDQGKFWEMHGGLYAAEAKDEENFVASAITPSPEGNGNLNRDLFVKIAKDSGADMQAFAACYDGRIYAGELDDIVAKGNAAGVSGTPTLFVDGVLLDLDPRAYPTWQSVVDRIGQSAK